MKKMMFLAVVLMLLPISANSRSLQEEIPDWTHIHGDAYHTGHSQVEIKPPLKLLWKKPGDQNIVGCRNGDTSLIFADDNKGNIICMNPETGQQIWKSKISENPVPNIPVIFADESGQKRIVAVSSGFLDSAQTLVTVHCLDMDGKRIWMNSVKGTFSQSSPTFQDGHIYVASGLTYNGASSGGYLTKIDAENGKRIWTADLPGSSVVSSPAKVGNHVFICCSEIGLSLTESKQTISYQSGAVLTGVNDLTGICEKQFKPRDMYMDILTVYDGTDLVVAGLSNGNIDAPDANLSKTIAGGKPNFVCRINPEDMLVKWIDYPETSEKDDMYANTPVVSGDWLLIGADDGTVFAYNKNDESKNWHRKLGIGIRMNMIASDNYIYLTEGDSPSNCCPNNQSKFKVVDIETGIEVWESWINNAKSGTISLFDKFVFVTDQNDLYCYTQGDLPTLSVNQQRISLGRIVKGDKAKFEFQILNTGTSRLDGIVRSSEKWIHLSTSSFDAGTDPITVSGTIDTTKLAEGSSYKVYASAVSKDGQVASVQISFSLYLESNLRISASKLDFGNVRFGKCAERQLILESTGSDVMTGTVVSASNWISFDTQTLTGKRQKISVMADTSLLEPGKEYWARILVRSNIGTEIIKAVVKVCQDCP